MYSDLRRITLRQYRSVVQLRLAPACASGWAARSCTPPRGLPPADASALPQTAPLWSGAWATRIRASASHRHHFDRAPWDLSRLPDGPFAKTHTPLPEM